MMTRHLRLLILALALASAAFAAPAGEDTPGEEASEADAQPTGRVVENLPCIKDPSQTYALYLPSAYDHKRRWPVLFAMDPRGRALIPLERFREAAERFGWIIVSSYNTLSDGPWEPNEKAMNAMLPDVQRRFAVDNHRLYLAGFSGTARVGWNFGYRLAGHVAGLIGFGGGLPGGVEPKEGVPFAFFGGAGVLDFNYEEMRALHARLDELGATNRFVSYPGPHDWGPVEVCEQAMAWMEVLAMKTSLRDKDPELIERLFAERLAAAKSEESAGRLYEAYVDYTALASEYDGLRDVAAVRHKAESLGDAKEVRRIIAHKDRIASRQRAWENRFYAFIQTCRTGDPPSVTRATIDLQLKHLKREAEAEDPLDAEAARRLLAIAFTNLSFYETRDYFDRKDFTRALAVTRIAEAIRPDSPQIMLNLARANAQLGHTDDALDALARLVQTGVVDAAFIEGDDLLAPLKSEERYRGILAKAPSGDPAGGD